MSDLDKPATYESLDPSDMRGRIRELPQQCRIAWQQALALELPPGYAGVDKVVILGMGGSAIGGDLLSSLVTDTGSALVTVNRDYDLPGFVDAGTLVIASSYSGMTEETLSSFTQALDTTAKKLVLTTGGRIAEIAAENAIPVFRIGYTSQPRAALAHSLFPLLGICQSLGIVGNLSQDVDETVHLLEELGTTFADASPASDNPAKTLARDMHGHLAVIYGAGILSPVAQRWKTQINENSKAWAFHEAFPELNHNAVVGYEFPKSLAEQAFVILLRSSHIHPRTRIRYDVVADVLEQAGIPHRTLDGSGESALSQMMSLVLLGDWVSYYLGILNDTDPTPVKVIDYLKKRLAEA
jgi:glucose/mannose-6-phosphate isomerase